MPVESRLMDFARAHGICPRMLVTPEGRAKAFPFVASPIALGSRRGFLLFHAERRAT